MCLVWRKEYDTVMLKALPLDLVLSAIPILIFAGVLDRYRLFRVLSDLLEFLHWLLDIIFIFIDDFRTLSILCLWCGSLGGQSCFGRHIVKMIIKEN